jgi:hypothetical protein
MVIIEVDGQPVEATPMPYIFPHADLESPASQERARKLRQLFAENENKITRSMFLPHYPKCENCQLESCPLGKSGTDPETGRIFDVTECLSGPEMDKQLLMAVARVVVSVGNRSFELVGNRGIKCDKPCLAEWAARGGRTNSRTIEPRELGVESDDMVEYCAAGEEEGPNADTVKTPALKQENGATPRVCLIHSGKVRDLITKRLVR